MMIKKWESFVNDTVCIPDICFGVSNIWNIFQRKLQSETVPGQFVTIFYQFSSVSHISAVLELKNIFRH